MGIGCRFGTGKTDNDRVDHSGNRGYSIPDGTVESGYRIGGMPATQQVRQSPLIEHTCGMASGEHVVGPLLAAPLGRIEVTAQREFAAVSLCATTIGAPQCGQCQVDGLAPEGADSAGDGRSIATSCRHRAS
jgi:hypothetical protein